MWNTPDAIRSLEGHERDLIVQMVAEMKTDINQGNFSTSVEIFRRMTKEEQIFSLAYVLSSLVDETEPKLTPNAWTDATIYAIFSYLNMRIQEEICSKTKRSTAFRKLLSRSLGIHSVPKSQWENMTERAADKILWDRDFENESFFMDLDPKLAAMHKSNLGIHEDYFVNPVPIVSNMDADKASALIDLITGERIQQPN